jgi:hypothetical protein
MSPSTVKTYLPWVVAVALFMEGLDTTIVNTRAKGVSFAFFPDQLAPISASNDASIKHHS